jgi:hypothetical protein
MPINYLKINIAENSISTNQIVELEKVNKDLTTKLNEANEIVTINNKTLTIFKIKQLRYDHENK